MSMIRLQGLSLSFPHKTCFSDFSAHIHPGQRIGLVGDNGSGKSSLLAMLQGARVPDGGLIAGTEGLCIAYVAQILPDDEPASGGERVTQAVYRALAQQPDLLLLDEPSNHLDQRHRQQLLRRLQHFYGTLVLVTHDDELLKQVCDTLWIFDQEQIRVFSGCYSDYLAAQASLREQLEARARIIKQRSKGAHQALMKEQERASHARERGIRSIENRKWATIKSAAKLGRGNTTAGKMQASLNRERLELSEARAACRPDTSLTPHFYLSHAQHSADTVVQLSDGAVGYNAALQTNLNLSLHRGERLWLTGGNGSGKSTLLAALRGTDSLRLGGDWLCPRAQEIAYLDQHHATLDLTASVLDNLRQVVPYWIITDCRRHLADFMFRAEEAVHAAAGSLSGGERTRLALACIAARMPQLLLLDEVTNHLDRTLRQHVIDVLKNYPGTMILVSHDQSFIDAIGIDTTLLLTVAGDAGGMSDTTDAY